jgi:iron complex transport system substrate-binding protein
VSRHSPLWAAIGVLAFLTTEAIAAQITLTDDLGRKVELEAPARRIVTLAPFLTELAFSAGAGDRVAGVSAHSDYPPEARALPQVASAAGIALESLLAVEPDLVIAWRDSIRPEEIERIRKFGPAVFVAQARRLEDVPRLLAAIGRMAGSDAAPAIRDYRAALERARRFVAPGPRITVFLEIWHRPLTTIAGPHWINEALALCGAENVFRDLRGVAPQVSWETLYARDPPLIVGAGSASSAADFRANWKARPALSAVKSGRLVFVPADEIQRPTVRLAQGVARLCEGLAPFR